MLKKKSLIALVSLLAIVCVSVGGTVAYLATVSDTVTNSFGPTQVTTSVVEDIKTNKTQKQDVKIKNTGTTDAWIRAAVIVTWQDTEGNVYGSAPVAGAKNDYTISYDVSTEYKENVWVAGNDGFYYWTSEVAPQGSTGILIKSVSPMDGKAPEGYSLCVEIIGSGIQAKGMGVDNAQDAWKIANGGTK